MKKSFWITKSVPDTLRQRGEFADEKSVSNLNEGGNTQTASFFGMEFAFFYILIEEEKYGVSLD